MANSFIGFPVPRAKIADMILSSAPPTIHHTQHEKGGADEIDCTGLTGAGGGDSVIEPEYEYQTYFDSIDIWTQYTSNGGTIELEQAGDVCLSTSTTQNGLAELIRKIMFAPVKLNWGKKLELETTVDIQCNTDKYGTVRFFCGQPDYQRHIGFKIVDGVLYGSVGNNSSETTTLLETIDTVDYYITPKLKAVLTPGSKCEFFVDDEKLGEITTGLPTGKSMFPDLIYMSVQNGAHTKILATYYSYVKFRQYP